MFTHVLRYPPLTRCLASGSRPRFLSYSSPAHGRPPPEISGLAYLTSERDHAAARAWSQSFSVDDIPKESLDISYSRSSGPGGQHVNKTNSKATVRCSLEHSERWLPEFVLPPLRRSQYHVASPSSLLVSSQTSRSAPQNLQAALKLLHETILSAATSTIVGETSAEQKSRVKGLMKAEEDRRRVQKDKRASKKASRRDE